MATSVSRPLAVSIRIASPAAPRRRAPPGTPRSRSCRHHHVEQHQVGPVAPDRGQRLAGRRARRSPRSLRASSGTPARPRCSARRRRSGSCCVMPCLLGRLAVPAGSHEARRQAPWPRRRARSQMRPPKCSTMLAADRQPQAGALRAGRARSPPWRKRSKISCCCSSGTPGPLSSTVDASGRARRRCVRLTPHPAVAGRHELGGVRQQVQHHLQSAGPHRRCSGGTAAGSCSSTRAPRSRNISAGGLHRLRQQRAQVDRRCCAIRRGPTRSWPCPAPG